MELHAVNLDPASLPRCFVLDQTHHIVMECSARPGQPLDPAFAPDATERRLPLVLDRAIEVLELNCVAEQTSTKSAILGGYTVKVQLLGGERANHTAVIIGLGAAA